MDQDAARPISNALIIYENVWLRKKCSKTGRNAQLLSTLPRIIRSARTPTEEYRTLGVQIANVLNHSWNRNAFAACTANQGVIDIDEHMNWYG